VVNFSFVFTKRDLEERLKLEQQGIPIMKALKIMKMKGYAVFINNGKSLELKYYSYDYGYGEMQDIKKGIITNKIEDFLDSDRYNEPSIKVTQKLKWQDNFLTEAK
jgi:hypothetical protein